MQLQGNKPLTLDVTLEKPGETQHEEAQFICCPADITIHHKVNLQDVHVEEDIKIRSC